MHPLFYIGKWEKNKKNKNNNKKKTLHVSPMQLFEALSGKSQITKQSLVKVEEQIVFFYFEIEYWYKKNKEIKKNNNDGTTDNILQWFCGLG